MRSTVHGLAELLGAPVSADSEGSAEPDGSGESEGSADSSADWAAWLAAVVRPVDRLPDGWPAKAIVAEKITATTATARPRK